MQGKAVVAVNKLRQTRAVLVRRVRILNSTCSSTDCLAALMSFGSNNVGTTPLCTLNARPSFEALGAPPIQELSFGGNTRFLTNPMAGSCAQRNAIKVARNAYFLAPYFLCGPGSN
eukprot:jgi/Mesvir1/20374/Mv25328-RA.1